MKNADFSKMLVYPTSFGTRGSQVQILPLRPIFPPTIQRLAPPGQKPARAHRDNYRDRNGTQDSRRRQQRHCGS